MPKKMGRPPKNMCKSCQGWGAVFIQQATLVLYGSGDVKEQDTPKAPRKQECLDRFGTGYVGGVMQQGHPPVMKQWDIEEIKEIQEHVEHNKRLEEAVSDEELLV